MCHIEIIKETKKKWNVTRLWWMITCDITDIYVYFVFTAYWHIPRDTGSKYTGIDMVLKISKKLYYIFLFLCLTFKIIVNSELGRTLMYKQYRLRVNVMTKAPLYFKCVSSVKLSPLSFKVIRPLRLQYRRVTVSILCTMYSPCESYLRKYSISNIQKQWYLCYFVLNSLSEL